MIFVNKSCQGERPDIVALCRSQAFHSAHVRVVSKLIVPSCGATYISNILSILLPWLLDFFVSALLSTQRKEELSYDSKSVYNTL